MSLFIELKQKLSQQLMALSASKGLCGGLTEPQKEEVQNKELQKKEQGLLALTAEISLTEFSTSATELNLLAWLNAQQALIGSSSCSASDAPQSRFPHVFWQSRDGLLTFATLGAVRQFSELTQAQAFSQQYGFRLFGGVKFEGQCRFILPRFVLAIKGDKLTACLYVQVGENPSELTEAWLADMESLQDFTLQPHDTQPSNHAMACKKAEKVSDFSRWERNIAKAIEKINAQHFRKVVLANATTLTFNQPISPYALLNASREKNIGCYHFLWAEQAGEAFIGSSPERLYKRTDREFHTEALAGTVAVTSDVAQTERYRLWLLSDQKNIYENQLVVDDIEQQLRGYIGEIAVHNIEIKRLANVQHLRRKIRGVLTAQTTDSDCLAHIHPTAAVAGLPRENALAFIGEHEGFTRGWYASALGSFTPDNAEFCVALRSAHIFNHQITLYAGAGIVENSEAHAEWEEIERKATALGELLQGEIKVVYDKRDK